MNTIPVATRANQGFTIQGDTLYYAGIARAHFDELQQLLSRGSGQVVRGGKRYYLRLFDDPAIACVTICAGDRGKIWFQAQCAHYGLPTENTLATLRLHLGESLELGKAHMEEKAKRVERDFRAAERRSCTTLPARPVERSPAPAARSVTPVTHLPESTQSHEGSATAIVLQNLLQTPIRTRPRALHVASPNAIQPPRPSYSFLPTPISRPRARAARRDPDSPTPNRGGASMENGRNESFVVSTPRATLPLDLAPPPYHPGPSKPQETRDQAPRLERDIVSGQWKLLVVHHIMDPPRALSRMAASRRRRGEVDVHLSPNRGSFTAGFALFGMDGIIKSKRLEPIGEGVRASVGFVAQIPGATEYEDTETLGPSKNRNGHLTFEAGKVRGMLSCPKYGKLEFEGVRIGVPRDLCVRWNDWL